MHLRVLRAALLFLLSTLISAHAYKILEPEQCLMISSDTVVRKEKVYEYKEREVRLSCKGVVRMNRCEGLCTSRVSPSVVTFPGFKKECKCCRESRMEEREVVLPTCTDGSVLVPGQFTTVHIREPTACHCFSCAV